MLKTLFNITKKPKIIEFPFNPPPGSARNNNRRFFKINFLSWAWKKEIQYITHVIHIYTFSKRTISSANVMWVSIGESWPKEISLQRWLTSKWAIKSQMTRKGMNKQKRRKRITLTHEKVMKSPHYRRERNGYHWNTSHDKTNKTIQEIKLMQHKFKKSPIQSIIRFTHIQFNHHIWGIQQPHIIW